MLRRRPEFESGIAGAEAAKLKKFSDAGRGPHRRFVGRGRGGSQSLWLTDEGRTDFSIKSGIKEALLKKWLAALLLTSGSLSAGVWDAYAGTHFNYTQIDFDAPSQLQGYTGGADAGVGCKYGDFFSQLGFEGSWNAGPITGTPCQRSSTTEYFLEWKLGWSFSAWRRQLFIDPYTGFGWDRFYNTQDPEGADLEFRYDKLFVPIGAFVYWRFYDCTRIGVQFEYRPDVYSKLNLIGISLDAKGQNSYRAQIPLIFESCCHRFNLSFIPFFDWSEYGRVEETNSAGALLAIPELIKWEIGLRMILDLKY